MRRCSGSDDTWSVVCGVWAWYVGSFSMALMSVCECFCLWGYFLVGCRSFLSGLWWYVCKEMLNFVSEASPRREGSVC